MVEKFIAEADENIETTKNESRASKIGKLQRDLISIYPSLINYRDCFFTSKVYFEGENVDENELEETKKIIISFDEAKRQKMESPEVVKKAA